jgi:hypothetical protein
MLYKIHIPFNAVENLVHISHHVVMIFLRSVPGILIYLQMLLVIWGNHRVHSIYVIVLSE